MSPVTVARLLVCSVFLMPITCSEENHPECGNIDDCSSEWIEMEICALDVQRFCFHKFRSRCEMKIVECQHRKKYIRYAKKFCYQGDLLCNDERIEFMKEWVRQHPVGMTVFSIYDKATDPDAYLKTFWKTMLYLSSYDI